MKNARPYERKKTSGEATDESHQDGEVRNDHGKQDGHDDHSNTKCQPINFQLAIKCPDGGEHGLGLTLEQFLLDHFTGGVIGQWVGKHGLAHEDDVDHCFQVWREVVHDLFLGVFLKRQEPHVAKECLKDGGSNVGPVQHAVEPRRIYHVALQGGEEDLRGVAEDDDPKGDGEGEDVDVQRHLAESPCSDAGKAEDEDDSVDEGVHDAVPEAEG